MVAVFVSVWWVWLLTTMFTNRFRTHDMTHRLLVLCQMFLVILVAMEAHEGVVRDGVYLSVTYAALIGTVAIMYACHAHLHDRAAEYARRRSRWLAAAAAVFVVGVDRPHRRAGLIWLIAFGLSVEPALRRSSPTDGAPGVDEHHLLERMGALTIIVCGEAFVKVAIAVSSGSVVEVDVIALVFQFVLTFAIWLDLLRGHPARRHPPRPAARVARAAPRAAARDGRHRHRRVEAGEDRAARPPAGERHPGDHRHARHVSTSRSACSGCAPGGGRCGRC